MMYLHLFNGIIQYGYTALIHATKEKREDVVRYLLETCKVDVDQQNWVSDTRRESSYMVSTFLLYVFGYLGWTNSSNVFMSLRSCFSCQAIDGKWKL